MSNDIEQFKKWFDSLITAFNFSGAGDYEMVPIAVRHLRFLHDRLEDLDKTSAALLVAQEQAARAEDRVKALEASSEDRVPAPVCANSEMILAGVKALKSRSSWDETHQVCLVYRTMISASQKSEVQS